MDGWKGDSWHSFCGSRSPFWGGCWKGVEGETGEEEARCVRRAVGSGSGKAGYTTGGNGLEENEKGKRKGKGRRRKGDESKGTRVFHLKKRRKCKWDDMMI
jgi:hypothetical protein